MSELIILCFLLICLCFWVFANVNAKDSKRNKYYLSRFEIEILLHYRNQGYTYIEPIQIGGYKGKFKYNGVKLISIDLPDIIMDSPFGLFKYIDKKCSINMLLKEIGEC